MDISRALGFFASVAATCILAVQIIMIFGSYRIATILWVFGLVLWLGLTFSIFTGFIVREKKPTLAEGINGSWLLTVVSTQSVALLTAKLAAYVAIPKLILNFIALSMWLWGGMLYIWLISLIPSPINHQILYYTGKHEGNSLRL